MKGFLLGFSLALFSIAIIVLSLTITGSETELNKVLLRAATLDSVNEEVNYIENSVGTIMKDFVNVTIRNNSIIYKGDVPDERIGILKAMLDDFIVFLKNHSDFSLDIKYDSGFSMEVNGIRIEHPNGLDGNVFIISNASNVVNYTVIFQINQNGTIGIDWKDEEAGTNRLNLSVSTNDNNANQIRLLDFMGGNEVDINIGNSTINMVIDRGPEPNYWRLKIDNENRLDLTLKIIADVNTNDTLVVSSSKQTINISSQEDNVTKITTFHIR